MDFLDSAIKAITKRLKPKENPLNERIYVAAFGKHPAWDDHMDAIGIQTDDLIMVKRILYVQGISGNIESGSWDKLSEMGQLDDFGHVFLWFVDASVVIGRLWPSQDGKGRSNYPMVICAHCNDMPLKWIIDNILPGLETLEQNCIKLSDSDLVVKAVNSSEMKFRDLAKEYDHENLNIFSVLYPDALSRLATLFKEGQGLEGLVRIIYHIEREVGPVDINNSTGKKVKSKASSLRTISLRVPLDRSKEYDSILCWISFIINRLGMINCLFLSIPDQKSWMDIVIGEPGNAQIYALRASLDAIPLTNSVPYNMNKEFLERTRSLLETPLGVDSDRFSVKMDGK